MSFVEPTFLAFFVLVFAGYWLLNDRRWQNLLLLVVSFVFYGWIHPWLMVLLFASAMLDYVAARRIVETPDRANLWLGLSVVGNIGALAFFKYFDFFIEGFGSALQSIGLQNDVHALGLFLPLGLSFYTFQTMSYTIDVWRKQLDMRTDVVDYLVYVCFFPQLVAGPVERAANVLPQFERPRTFNQSMVRSGLSLALWGAFKKVVLADTLAPYVDLVFVTKEPSAAMIWAGALGFTVQVLADFSGYTDIARGTARMLGIELMDNFDHPYLAASPMEFWQRWHISFSTWLRDYLYLPLSFSPWVRKYLTIPGTEPWGYLAHTSRALFITMLASGLWHGSTVNYVAWGMYYWALGSAYAYAQAKIPKRVKRKRNWRPFTVPLMFAFTVTGMLIFRVPSLGRLGGFLTLNPLAGTQDQWIATTVLLSVTLAVALPSVLAMLASFYVLPKLERSPYLLPVQTTLWTAASIAMFIFARGAGADFVYFQF